jgi:hypothetical protein
MSLILCFLLFSMEKSNGHEVFDEDEDEEKDNI